MTEMAFSPSSVAVAKGERITFRFVNNGNVVHEAVLGDEAFQREHEQLMKAPASTAKGDGHGDHQHDSSNTVTVGPGPASFTVPTVTLTRSPVRALTVTLKPSA